MITRSLVPEEEEVALVEAATENQRNDAHVVATQDPELIQHWAQLRGAEPATGEATPSGPATVDVHDGDAGIRFNFPGAAPYRPIEWPEWFDHFRHHELVFVYETTEPEQPPSARYRLLKMESLKKRATVVA